MTSKKKLKERIRARMEKTGESYQMAHQHVAGGAVAIHHVVRPKEGFEESARILFDLVRCAQRDNPGKPRLLYLDIEGHRASTGAFDADMLELMTDYVIKFLGRYLSEVHMPLADAVLGAPQDNDIPDELRIGQSPQAPDAQSSIFYTDDGAANGGPQSKE